MSDLDWANYLYYFNDWIVLPVVALAGLRVHLRYRKLSTLMLSFGLTLVLIGNIFTSLFAQAPLNTLYIGGVALGTLGLVVAVSGFVWFMRKHYVQRTSET